MKQWKDYVDEAKSDFDKASPIARLIWSCEVFNIDQHASDDLMDIAEKLERLERCEKALAEAAMPYEALLIDRDSRNWIAPELWKMIEHFVQSARVALKETE